MKPKEVLTIRTIIGHTSDIQLIYQKQAQMTTMQYVDDKRKEAEMIINQLTDKTYTQTSNPVFDAYVRQNFLDNVLRGGYPTILKGESKEQVYHLYSRKHGDLERDYNFLNISR